MNEYHFHFSSVLAPIIIIIIIIIIISNHKILTFQSLFSAIWFKIF
ncbi:MAG: hypothetical protein N7Q72_00685 [Spiroplasma sp. Tabriz.8]|nr:hypothetical protein [Spiroplasma sp. Tabriz.8]